MFLKIRFNNLLSHEIAQRFELLQIWRLLHECRKEKLKEIIGHDGNSTREE
jgi:hypothetical protein